MNNITSNNSENITALDNAQTLIKQKCKIQISEIKDGHNSVCHVISTGKSSRYNWQKSFRSVYGDWAMLMSKHLIDLPGKRFLVRQINEHSRGGHCEYEVYLLDLYGKILNQFAGRYHSKFILDDKYIWFYVSGEKPHSYTSNLDLKMMKLNYNTGIVVTVNKGETPSHIDKLFWN